MTGQPAIDRQQSIITRNRGGAPKGNLNALKHGFYTSRSKRTGLKALNHLLKTQLLLGEVVSWLFFPWKHPPALAN
jgi:hypothetical protein